MRLLLGLVACSVLGLGAPKLRINGNLIYNAGDGALQLTAVSKDSWLTTQIVSALGCPQPECYRLETTVGPGAPRVGDVVSSVVISDTNAIDSPQVISVPVRNGAYDIPDRLEFWIRYEATDSTVAPESPTRDICSVVPLEAAVISGQPWLTVTNRAGPPCEFVATLKLAPPRGLGPGDFSGSVSILSNQSRKVIPVTLHITPADQSLIEARPSQLRFQIVRNGPKLTRVVTADLRRGGTVRHGEVKAVTEDGRPWLAAQWSDPTFVLAWIVTVDPAGLEVGRYRGLITADAGSAKGPITITVDLEVEAASPPVVEYRGVVENATFSLDSGLAPGGIAAAFGRQFRQASEGARAGSVPLPLELSGLRVFVNERPAPLYYADYEQINFQAPYETEPGEALIRVERNGQRGNTVSAQVAPIAPRLVSNGLFSVFHSSGARCNFAGGAIGGAGNPCRRGEIVSIYGINWGATVPAVSTGQAAPADPLARVTRSVVVYFGSKAVSAEPLFVGLSPGSVGLCQVNVKIPEEAEFGTVEVWISIDGVETNRVSCAIV
jgi:uncharacterized protein (TIGR03437 family)